MGAHVLTDRPAITSGGPDSKYHVSLEWDYVTGRWAPVADMPNLNPRHRKDA